MLAWIALAGLLGYLVCALVTARAAFAVLRARLISEQELWHRDADPVESFEHHDRGSAATTAFLFGIAWPVTVPGYCVSRCVTFVITARPRPTDHERRRRADRLQQRIRELEASLDMQPLDLRALPLDERLRSGHEER